MPDYWGGNYRGSGRVSSPFPVLVFISGRGLAGYARSYEEISGKWSADSRYYAYAADPVVEYNLWAGLFLIDTASVAIPIVGGMVRSREGFEYEYEFAGGYLLWVDEEPIEEPGPRFLERRSATPVLFAYDLETGRKSKLLEADLETLQLAGTEGPGRYWTKYYPVKMVNADPCPGGVEGSPLYIKYNENDAFAVNRELRHGP
jgi:hypothetical protein